MVYGAASVYKGIHLRGREAYTTVPNGYNSEFHAQKQSSGNWILKKLKKERLLNTIWLEASGSM